MSRLWPLPLLVAAELYLVFLNPVGLAVSPLGSGSFPIGPLDPGLQVSQTFTMRASGLREIEIYPLVTGDPANTALIVELHQLQPDGTARSVYRASRPLTETARDGAYRFRFPPLEESHRQPYRLDLSVGGQDASGSLSFWASEASAVPDGSLFVNGRAHPADLAFATRATRATAWSRLRRYRSPLRVPVPPVALFLALLAVIDGVVWVACRAFPDSPVQDEDRSQNLR